MSETPDTKNEESNLVIAPETPVPNDVPVISRIGQDLKDVFSDEENAKKACLEILEKIKNCKKEELDYDFMLSMSRTDGTTIQQNTTDPNVSINFDASDPDSVLYKIKTTEFSRDVNDEELNYIAAYHAYICETLFKNHRKEVEDLLRYRIFKSNDVPLELNAVAFFDIADLRSCAQDDFFSLIVEKDVPESLVKNPEYMSVSGVSPELIKINRSTGKDFNQIILDKKKEGDPAYKYVKCAYRKRIEWEGQIKFVVQAG